MARAAEVLRMLLPDGGYVLVGEDFEGLEFTDCKPITKSEFEAGFDKYDAWKAEQDLARATEKQELLDRLGITADEAKLLLS
jgi:hypothetical protein